MSVYRGDGTHLKNNVSRSQKVFLSGSLVDLRNPLLQKFIGTLEKQADIEILTLTHTVPSGGSTSIIDLIVTGIRQVDFIFVVFSEHTWDSKWVNFEIDQALSNESYSKSTKLVLLSIDGSFPQGHSVRDRMFVNLKYSYDGALNHVLSILRKNEGELLATFDIDRLAEQRSTLEISSKVYDKLLEHFVQHPEEMFSLPSRKFEELIAELFSRFGYEVELTQQTRDGGRDVIAIQNRIIKTKHLIECRRYAPQRSVSISAVRELYGVKEHEKATKAILATTGRFTRNARLFFEDHMWELEPRDYEGLLDWLEDYRKMHNGS